MAKKSGISKLPPALRANAERMKAGKPLQKANGKTAMPKNAGKRSGKRG